MIKRKATREKTEKNEKIKSKKQKKQRESVNKKKSHDEGYVLKKNTGMRILRVFLWVMLSFIFIRGIISIFNSDKEEKMQRMISDFKTEYSEFTNQNNEVMAFAQNFAREYLTYDVKKEEDYKARLSPYVAKNFFSNSINDFRSTAKAIYVQAYRLEEYSKNQMDVYVLAEVEYTSRHLDEENQAYVTESTQEQVMLNIPVYLSNGAYVVENIPLPVNDSIYLEQYSVKEYYGTTMDDTTALQTSIENFLKAYFEQDESIINYYLDASADKEKFAGLKGRFSFLGIEDLKCFREQPGEDIICLVTFKLQDGGNAAKLLQKVNLCIREGGEKYYIKSMGNRIGNMNCD